MTTTTQADLEREDARNKTNGEFGTHTHTAPEAALKESAADTMVAQFDTERYIIAQERYLLEKKEFDLTAKILETYIHAENLDGIAHTLYLEDVSDDGEPFWNPAAIEDFNGKVLWELDGSERVFGDRLETYTPLLGHLGTRHLELNDGHGSHGIILNPPKS
jgi:hypothetical protein